MGDSTMNTGEYRWMEASKMLDLAIMKHKDLTNEMWYTLIYC